MCITSLSQFVTSFFTLFLVSASTILLLSIMDKVMSEGKNIISFLNQVYLLLSHKLFRVYHPTRLSSFFLSVEGSNYISAFYCISVIIKCFYGSVLAVPEANDCSIYFPIPLYSIIQQPYNLTNIEMLYFLRCSRLLHQEHSFVVRQTQFQILPPSLFRCMRLDKISRLQLPYLCFGTNNSYLIGFLSIFNYIIY